MEKHIVSFLSTNGKIDRAGIIFTTTLYAIVFLIAFCVPFDEAE